MDNLIKKKIIIKEFHGNINYKESLKYIIYIFIKSFNFDNATKYIIYSLNVLVAVLKDKIIFISNQNN